jgi:hypothetical protein
MPGARPYVALLVLPVLAMGCSGNEREPARAPVTPSSPTDATSEASEPTPSTPKPIPQQQLDRLDKLLSNVRFPDRLEPGFELREVHYSSARDAIAEFVRTGGGIEDWATAVAITQDNWRHATTLVVPDSVANGFESVLIGDGAVVVKVGDEYSPRPIPPFVLHPDRTVSPLQTLGPRTLDGNAHLIDAERYGFAFGIGRFRSTRLWAVDVDAAELFPIEGSRFGELWERVPGRDRAILSVQGYKRRTQIWSFDTSSNAGRTWHAADVPLPLRGTFPVYSGASEHAVGPGLRQSVAVTQSLEDLPARLHGLWQTENEVTFHRVRLPRGFAFFGGVAYASDGALLLAEVQGPTAYCGSGDPRACNRPGRIWRLGPRGAEFELLPEAPQLFGHFGMVGISVSGGMIVARTGHDTVAVSPNGYDWTEVRPGR